MAVRHLSVEPLVVGPRLVGAPLASPRRRMAAFAVEVVRLDDRPLTIVESFERFLGYWQIPASLGTALFDFWRDPNRRLPHDRLVHTAVIRQASPKLKQRSRAHQS